MKKSSKLTLIIIAILAIFGISLAATNLNTYAADICSQLPNGSEVWKANGCGGNSSTDLTNVIIGIVNGIVGALSLVAVIVVVIGGVNYMTSTGDAGKVQKAKNTILYALIGLVICVLAFAIVNFVIANIINSSTEEDENSYINATSLAVARDDL